MGLSSNSDSTKTLRTCLAGYPRRSHGGIEPYALPGLPPGPHGRRCALQFSIRHYLPKPVLRQVTLVHVEGLLPSTTSRNACSRQR